jgi:2-dehydro-3-deoxy-phosphogluconate aldolase
MIRLNVLAKNVENAKEIVEATEGRALIGVMVKGFATTEEAVERVLTYQEAGVPVSVGLGAGDPAQWQKVVEVALRTKPVHVNQVFPAAAYTLGALKTIGSSHTVVNALITPAGTPGQVIISTGPRSAVYQEAVSADVAAAMLAEMGIPSVKFFPIQGTERLDEVAAMVKAAVKHGIETFEPTGGIGVSTIREVVEVCLENGAKEVIPHVYTSIVDPATGITRLEDIRQLLAALSGV